MNNTKNNLKKIPLLRYYHSLMVKKGERLNKRAASKFRERVIDECDIAPRTFYYWLKYPQKISKSDQKTIIRLAKVDIDFVKKVVKSGK